MATVAIEAGRELDALVAVEVMGWTRQRLGQWVKPDGGPTIAEPNRYSTTGDGMLEVLERMRGLGWIGVCKVSTDTRSYARFSRNARPGETHAVNGKDVEADTLPHAVCLAALEAVRA